jgi:hypothetical protein
MPSPPLEIRQYGIRPTFVLAAVFAHEQTFRIGIRGRYLSIALPVIVKRYERNELAPKGARTFRSNSSNRSSRSNRKPIRRPEKD